MSRLYPGLQQNEFNTNFETYMSKLLKKKAEIKPRVITNRETKNRINNNPNLQSSRVVQIQNANKVNPSLVVPYINTEENSLHLSDDELVHKEVINNKMAQVEVTVRTVSSRNRSRSNSVSAEKREPWSKLLQSKKSGESVNHNVPNYDYGLATIHYLSKELEHKLKSVPLGDPSLQQIVNNIQHTLYRINPVLNQPQEEIFTSKNASCETTLNGKINTRETEKPSKLSKVNQSMQTVNIGDTDKNIPMSSNMKNYESNSREETFINKIKMEKSELERQLQNERETIKRLEQKLNEKSDQSALLKQLREEKEFLEKKLRDSSQCENDKKYETQELIQKLRTDNASIEYDNMNLKHEMTIMKLEKEKMVFLLESRDKQIKALKNEIEAIQSLVSSQIFDLKSSCYTPSLSRTSIASKNFASSARLTKAKQIQDLYLNKMKSSDRYTSSSTVLNENSLCKKETTSTIKTDYQDEFPQRDIPSTTSQSPRQMNLSSPLQLQLPKPIPSDFTVLSEVPDLMKDDLETNIKEMFEELKRQAMVVTLSPNENRKESQTTKGSQSIN